MGRGTRTLAEKGVKSWANFPTREREREPVCEGISARLESVSQQKREKPRRSNTAKERGEAGRASERVWNRNYRLLGVRGHAQVWKTSGKSSELDGGVQESAKKGENQRERWSKERERIRGFDLKWWSLRSQEEMEAYFERNNNNKLIIWRILPFRPLFTCFGAKNIRSCGVGCSRSRIVLQRFYLHTWILLFLIHSKFFIPENNSYFCTNLTKDLFKLLLCSTL